MINPSLNVKKTFKEQVEKCMYTTFGEIIQPFIRATLSKNNTHVLALIMSYETRGDNPKIYFIVLSCVVYSILENCVYIDYLACTSKTKGI